MTKFIEPFETIADKKSDFNIKRFKIGKINSERSIKSIDARTTTREFFDKEVSNFKNKIFETSKRIDYDTLRSVLKGRDSHVKSFFGYPEWLDCFENVISPTFTFNPNSMEDRVNELSGFFSYYYNFSKTFLFVPNVKATEIIYGIGKTGRKKKIDEKPIITIEDYIDFVNESYTILNERNTKPIFLPLSLKFPIEDMQKLIREYIFKDYLHVWIDFEGEKTTDRAKLGKLRLFYTMLRSTERFNDSIIYITNMRREITSNPQRNENPSSDVLTSLCGGNFVGVNLELRRNPNPWFPPINPEAQQALWEYRARVFNPDTYYYINRNLSGVDETTSNLLLEKGYNVLFNSKQLDFELENQANQFLIEFDFEEYISNKKMLSNDPNGSLKKRIFYKKYESRQASLDDDYKMP